MRTLIIFLFLMVFNYGVNAHTVHIQLKPNPKSLKWWPTSSPNLKKPFSIHVSITAFKDRGDIILHTFPEFFQYINDFFNLESPQGTQKSFFEVTDGSPGYLYLRTKEKDPIEVFTSQKTGVKHYVLSAAKGKNERWNVLQTDLQAHIQKYFTKKGSKATIDFQYSPGFPHTSIASGKLDSKTKKEIVTQLHRHGDKINYDELTIIYTFENDKNPTKRYSQIIISKKFPSHHNKQVFLNAVAKRYCKEKVTIENFSETCNYESLTKGYTKLLLWTGKENVR